jgi:hypothetical protein
VASYRKMVHPRARQTLCVTSLITSFNGQCDRRAVELENALACSMNSCDIDSPLTRRRHRLMRRRTHDNGTPRNETFAEALA